jgi:hypothetical protein
MGHLKISSPPVTPSRDLVRTDYKPEQGERAIGECFLSLTGSCGLMSMKITKRLRLPFLVVK